MSRGGCVDAHLVHVCGRGDCGEIVSVLGVVVPIAGSWAPASSVLEGAVAFVTARSYIGPAERFGGGGGALTFLSRLVHPSLAGSLSWLLIAGSS